jgi:hypothetical protein
MRTAKTLLHTLVGISMVFYTLAIGLLAVPSVANAQTVGSPTTIGYNGRLFNASGTALTGTYYIWVDLESALTGGTNLAANIQVFSDADGDSTVDAGETAISVTNGFFTVEIPISTDIADFNNNVFLELKVHTADAVGSAETLSPRVKVTKSPYAIVSQAIERSSADPTTGFEGRMYYDTDEDEIKFYDGTTAAWVTLASTLDDAYNNFGTAAQIITVDDATTGLSLDVAAAGHLDVDLQSTGDFRVQDAGTTWAQFTDAQAFDVDGTGAISLDADAASNFNTSAGDLTFDSEAGSVNVDGGEADSAAVRVNASNAAGGIDVDAGTGGIAIDTTGALSLDSASASNYSVSAGDLTLFSSDTGNAGTYDVVISAGNAAPTAGEDGNDIALEAEDDLLVQTTGDSDFDVGGAFNVDSTGAISLDSGAASNFTTSAGDLTLSASAASVVIQSAEAVSDSILLDADGTAGGGVYLDAYDSTNNTTGRVTMDGAAVIVNTFGSIAGIGNAGFDVNVGDSGTLAMNTTSGSVSITGGGASGSVDFTSTQNSITIDTQTAANSISLGTSNVSRTINVGTGTGADQINVGAGADLFDFVSTSSSVANDVWDITFDSFTQSNGIDYSFDSLTSGSAFRLSNTSAFSGDIFDIETTSTWTGNVFQYDDTGNAIWEGNIFAITTGTADATGDVMNIQLEAGSSGTQAIVINNDAASDVVNAGWGIDIDASGIYTADVIYFDNTGDTASSGDFVSFRSGTGDADGDVMDITLEAGATSTQIFDVNNAAVSDEAGWLLEVDNTGVTTGNMIDINFSSASTGHGIFLNNDSQVATGTIMYIDSDADRSSAHLLRIDDVADGTASVPTALISLSGATDQAGLQITGAGGNVAGGNLLDLDFSTAAAAANAIDIDVDGQTHTGDGVNITAADAAVGFQALVIDTAGGVQTASPVFIDWDNTSGTVAAVDIDQAGTRGGVLDIDIAGALITLLT